MTSWVDARAVVAKNAATLAAVPPSLEWTTMCRIADARAGVVLRSTALATD
jgi:hypothetical protein